MTESPADLLCLFTRRDALLRRLADGPVRKPELVRSLDVSRSTVDRSVRELVGSSVVERGEGGYRLTLGGRMLFAEYRRFRERAVGVSRASDVLSVLPPDADLDPVVLVGATVTESTRTAPYRPVEDHLELVRSAGEIRLIPTAITPRYVRELLDRVVNDGLDLSVGCPPHVFEHLVSETVDPLREACESGRLTLRELGSTPPFTLGILEGDTDTEVSLLAYGEGGVRAHVRNSDPEAIAWAEEFFDARWTRGNPVTPMVVSEQ